MPGRISWYARNFMPVRRNRAWWRSDLPVSVKASYYPHALWSLLRMFRGHRAVNYLGRRLWFDNPATLINLQVYPYELSRMILRHVEDPRSVRTVLDVGGNIGQFAVTAAHFLPGAAVDVFEPNPHALTYLRRNLEGLPGVRIFPYALSGEPAASLYFEPNRSATGSLFAENIGRLWEPARTPVETIADVGSTTGRDHYDLIKVDVESAEFEAIRCLRGLSTRYLFVELSTARRAKPYLHSELFDLLRELFGEFDILAQDELTEGMSDFDVLIRFRGKEPGAPDTYIGDMDSSDMDSSDMDSSDADLGDAVSGEPDQTVATR